MARYSIEGQQIKLGTDHVGYIEGSNIKDRGGSKIGRIEGSRIYDASGAQIANVEGQTLYTHEKRRTYKGGNYSLPLAQLDKDLADASLSPALKGALYEFFIDPK